jgi:endonuclease YncB( thermonuclease family)
MIREWYWDFGPTLVAEKLREVHEITLGRETLRLWMIEAGLLARAKAAAFRAHQQARSQAAAKARPSAPLAA